MRVKGRLSFAGIAAGLLFIGALFILGGGKSNAGAMLPEGLSGRKVESLEDGKMVDLGELSKGRPFYAVFSTPT